MYLSFFYLSEIFNLKEEYQYSSRHHSAPKRPGQLQTRCQDHTSRMQTRQAGNFGIDSYPTLQSTSPISTLHLNNGLSGTANQATGLPISHPIKDSSTSGIGMENGINSEILDQSDTPTSLFNSLSRISPSNQLSITI